MARTRTDLESLEALFLETMKTSVRRAALADMVSHARRTGTAVGEQIKTTLETLTQQITAVSKAQMETGMQLTGMADRVKHGAASSKATQQGRLMLGKRSQPPRDLGPFAAYRGDSDSLWLWRHGAAAWAGQCAGKSGPSAALE